MYGVPANLDLSHFVGTTLIQVCVGPFDLQLRFHPDAWISVESKWIVTAGPARQQVQAVGRDDLPYSRIESLSVIALLNLSVTGVSVNAPESFSLTFDSGHTLTVFDDSEKYESFSIHPGDIYV